MNDLCSFLSMGACLSSINGLLGLRSFGVSGHDFKNPAGDGSLFGWWDVNALKPLVKVCGPSFVGQFDVFAYFVP